MDFKTQAVPLRLADEKAGIVEGYASTWGPPADSYNHVIVRGAFSTSLAKHAAEGSAPIMLWAHNAAAPVGRWLSMKEDGYGLLVRGQLNLSTTAGREAFAHLQAGDLNGLSIGVRHGPESLKQAADGTTLLSELELAEISLVALPANGRARVTSVKNYSHEPNLLDVLLQQVATATKAFSK